MSNGTSSKDVQRRRRKDPSQASYYADMAGPELGWRCADYGLPLASVKARSVHTIPSKLASRYVELYPYHDYTAVELRQAAKLRGLVVSKLPKRADLIRAIDAFEEKISLPLLDLPVEIRNLIYVFSFLQRRKFISWHKLGNYGTGEGGLGEPPITLTSKQVRDEARPVFYAVRRFPMEKFPSQTAWLTQLKHDAFRYLRAFIVDFRGVEVDLIAKGSTFQITSLPGTKLIPRDEQWQRRFLQRLSTICGSTPVGDFGSAEIKQIWDAT